MILDRNISQQKNDREGFFGQLLSKGKEGKIIFPNPNTWSIALSREILLTIINLSETDFDLSFEDWVNFFYIYILNWNNNVNTNPNVYEREVIRSRNQFISSICDYGFDHPSQIDLIGQARDFIRDHPESRGVFLTTQYYHDGRFQSNILLPWNNQMTIDEC